MVNVNVRYDEVAHKMIMADFYMNKIWSTEDIDYPTLNCLFRCLRLPVKQAMKPLPENASMMFSNKYFFKLFF